MVDSLLIIFAKNPELGKVKTRLAADIGDEKALDIYRYLLRHTINEAKISPIDKVVYFSEKIPQKILFKEKSFKIELQQGEDLGERMENAFRDAFNKNYKKVIIIGTDLPDITAEDINTAFRYLDKSDYVFGPAQDGGYYLLGMKSLNSTLFKNINWSTATVLEESLAALSGNNKNENYPEGQLNLDYRVKLLETKNDVDTLADIGPNSILRKILNRK